MNPQNKHLDDGPAFVQAHQPYVTRSAKTYTRSLLFLALELTLKLWCLSIHKE